jgi:hypothetical protein
LLVFCITFLHSTAKITNEFKQIANITYSKVLPCIMDSWMMKKRGAVEWHFPGDAEEHYLDLINKTARFRTAPVHEYAGYSGPWIENIFITKYMSKPLSFFNGLIPLFVQWIDTDIVSKREFNNLNAFLSQALRPNVLYMAVSQGDIGLGKCGTEHPNILALACGGYGHVPVPLIRGEIPWVEPPLKYEQDFGFFGNARQSSRPDMLKIVKETAEGLNMTFKSGHGPSWKQDMEHTKYNLAPRGYGRSSFRFAESVQMGRIPVFVYDDLPWIPYDGSNISVGLYGFSGGLNAVRNHTLLKETVWAIGNMTEEGYQKKLQALRNVRKYFTYEGVFEQVEAFLKDPFGPEGGQLRCTVHPNTERCCG